MFRQQDIQVIGRFAILLLMLVFISACRDTAPIGPDVTPELIAPQFGATGEPIAREQDSVTSDHLATETPEVVNSPTAARPTAVVEDELTDDLDPCGLLLPLTRPSSSVVKNLSSPEIPNGLVPDSALPALERLFEAPETVGLAAFELGRESEGVYLNAESPMPLASVVKIINLIAYANAAAGGNLDPASWILLSDLEKFYLPGMDLGAHRRGVRDLEERSLVAGDPSTTPLEEVPGLMIQHSSNAASDYIHLAVGQEEIERTILDLDLTSHTAPCPWIGQFLVMNNHDRTGSDRTAVTALIDDPAAYGREVMRLTMVYADDPNFRDAELSSRDRSSGVTIQAQFADNLNAQASAADYARLMARIMQNGLESSYANILVRLALEWPMQFSTNQDLFSTLGYKNGSLPGVLTTVYYARRLEDGSLVVVALFYRQLPLQTYRQWRRTLPHDELARWLLSDPEAIPTLREMLE